MPIDYSSIQSQKEKELNDFLTQNKSDISSIQPSIDQSFANDALSSYGGASPLDRQSLRASIQSKIPSLTRAGEQQSSQYKFDRERTLSNVLYQEAVRNAKEAGYSEQAANDYATQLVNQRQTQSFKSGQEDLDRQAKLKYADLQDVYAKKGIDLYDQYSNFRPDRSGALMRMLVGTGAAIGTGYYLNKRNQPQPEDYYGQDIAFRQNLPQDSLTSQSRFTPVSKIQYSSFNKFKPNTRFNWGTQGLDYQYGGDRGGDYGR